ncbi:MAG: hypothetical protein KZQ58_05155 [gamma proteobacterium symbiont of Bathyaustriella thionipta]|nr:hypothetical protein [gamma proteobacterium symbiont of Bathyaustriella thionipta]
MKATRILLTGASSPSGMALLSALQSQADTAVSAVSRQRQNKMSGIDWLQADFSTAGVLAGLMKSADRLVHMAGLPLLAAELKELKSSHIRQIIAFSTSSVLTKKYSPNRVESELIQSIARAEQQLLTFCESRNISLSIIRPTLIWGAGRDRNVSRIARWAASQRIFPSYRGLSGLRQPVHVEDLASLVIRLMQTETKGRQVFVAAGGEILNYRQMVSRIYATLAKKPVFLPLPAWIVDRAVHWPTSIQPTLVMLQRTRLDMVFERNPLLDELDWHARGFDPDQQALGL